MKKAFALLVLVSFLFASCADSLTVKRINPETKKEQVSVVQPYGIFNPEDKVAGVQYKVNIGNVVWDVIAIETIIVPVVLVGWQFYEPVNVIDENLVFAPK